MKEEQAPFVSLNISKQCPSTLKLPWMQSSKVIWQFLASSSKPTKGARGNVKQWAVLHLPEWRRTCKRIGRWIRRMAERKFYIWVASRSLSLETVYESRHVHVLGQKECLKFFRRTPRAWLTVARDFPLTKADFFARLYHFSKYFHDPKIFYQKLWRQKRNSQAEMNALR